MQNHMKDQFFFISSGSHNDFITKKITKIGKEFSIFLFHIHIPKSPMSNSSLRKHHRQLIFFFMVPHNHKIRERIFKRIFERKFAKEYSKENPRKNIRKKIHERIFEQKTAKTPWRKLSVKQFSKKIRKFHILYFYAVILSNIFSKFLSNILSRNFCRISFTDFLSNMVMRDHVKNQLTVVLSEGTVTQRRFSLKHSLWIFFRILFRGLSFQYSFADFLSNIFSRIFCRIFF